MVERTESISLSPVSPGKSVTPHTPHKPKGYWDLVALQFRKNTVAVISMATIGVLFLVAAWAPLLANGKPYVWTKGGATTSPLLDNFLAPEFNIDLIFNYFCLATMTIPLALGVMVLLREVGKRTYESWIFWAIGAGVAWLPFLEVRATRSAGDGTSGLAYSGWASAITDPAFSFLFAIAGIAVVAGGILRLAKITSKQSILVRGFWFFCAVLALVFCQFVHTGFRPKTLDTREHFGQMAAKLDRSKGERAIFPLIPDPISPSADPLKAPDQLNWLGSDSQGRDVLARMLHGSRTSLSVGFVAESIAVLLGVFFGAMAGFYRGRVDIAISRFIEVVICFPAFFLILIVIAYSTERSIFYIMVVIGLTSWPGIARLVRGEFLRLSELEYVQSARALGASSLRIMFRHMLPNAMGPVLVSAAFGVAGAILTESGLSFLGFGAPPPTPTWGEMIKQGNENIDSAWWLIVFPGFSIFLTVTIYNLVGDGLRDAMDPKMRK